MIAVVRLDRGRYEVRAGGGLDRAVFAFRSWPFPHMEMVGTVGQGDYDKAKFRSAYQRAQARIARAATAKAEGK